MAKKRKNFIREKRIYCGEEYLEVDIVAVTNMPEAGKGKKGKSSQAQKNLNDKRTPDKYLVEWLKPNHIIKIKKTAGTDDRK